MTTITINNTQLSAAACPRCGARMYPASLLPAHMARHLATDEAMRSDSRAHPKTYGMCKTGCGNPAVYRKTQDCKVFYGRKYHAGHRARINVAHTRGTGRHR